MVQQLNVPERRMKGEPVVLLKNVGSTTAGSLAASVSRTGILAYAEPLPTSGELIWFSRDGRPLGPPVGALADYVTVALSPDDNRVAFGRIDPQTGTSDVWLSELARGVTTRLTSDPMNDAGPIWSPDGVRILFRSNRGGFNQLFVKGTNDARAEELFYGDTDVGQVVATDYSRDGSHVIFTNTGDGSSFNLWDLPTESLRRREVLQTSFDEYQGVLSPDGRFLAYVSEETGVPQVYVQSFPNGEQRAQVSSQGGSEPRWRDDGRELFFLRADRTMMAMSVSLRPTFQAEEPSPLFQTRVPILANPYRWHYDVSADGERFLINTAPAFVPPPAIHVVMDWRALLPRSEK
jgi:dipeptidyl aminopeptidase/acylaminoacyl peptidase